MIVLHLLAAAVCLALFMDALTRRGAGVLRSALGLCTGGAAVALLGLVLSGAQDDAAGAWSYMVAMRVGVASLAAGTVGVGLALAGLPAPLHPHGLLWGTAALMGALALAVGSQVPVDSLVRTRSGWTSLSPAVRLLDTGLGTLSAVLCVMGALRGLRHRAPRARRSAGVVMGLQVCAVGTFVVLRFFAPLDAFHAAIALLTAGTSGGFFWALRNLRVAGMHGEALELLFDRAAMPTAILDLQTDEVILNPAASTLLGARGLRPDGVVAALGLGVSAEGVLGLLRGRVLPSLRVPGAQGRVFDLQCSYDRLRGLGLLVLSEVTERVEHTQRLARAVSELESAQQRLVAQERMAALGGLIAGINHELNNPLAYVGASVRELGAYLCTLKAGVDAVARLEGDGEAVQAARRWASSPEVRTAVEEGGAVLHEALQGCERLAETVSSLRTLTRQEEAEQGVDLAALVRAGVKVGRVALGPGVRLREEVAEPLPMQGVPGELSAVVTNLVANAGQALGGDGEVRVRAWREGACAVVEVADDGPGIPQELQRRIFEPFFTTKKEGTGLGLAISYETVRRHRGELTVDSAPGQGTRFRVRLPLDLDARPQEARRTG